MAEDPPLLCALVIDENEEIICGESGVVEVLVRNRFGLFVVTLCTAHKQEHRNFYRQRALIRHPRRVVRKENEDVNACHNPPYQWDGVNQNAKEVVH